MRAVIFISVLACVLGNPPAPPPCSPSETSSGGPPTSCDCHDGAHFCPYCCAGTCEAPFPTSPIEYLSNEDRCDNYVTGGTCVACECPTNAAEWDNDATLDVVDGCLPLVASDARCAGIDFNGVRAWAASTFTPVCQLPDSVPGVDPANEFELYSILLGGTSDGARVCPTTSGSSCAGEPCYCSNRRTQSGARYGFCEAGTAGCEGVGCCITVRA